MNPDNLEMRWIEEKVGAGRARLVLQYRTRMYNVMGKLLEFTEWKTVPRVVADDSDGGSNDDEA